MRTNNRSHPWKLPLLALLLFFGLLLSLFAFRQTQDIRTKAAGTPVSVTLFLHGIGKGGDAANPVGSGNMSPGRTQRAIQIEVYNQQNQLVGNQQGTVTYNSTNGNFTGTIDLGTTLPTGVYTVKIKSNQYLRGLVPGIQTITSGQTATLPPTYLITGDSNNDNIVNIQDYNILIGCYSDLTPATNCTATQKAAADITDDGNVNSFDYNLFLRELTNISGEIDITGSPTPTPPSNSPTPTQSAGTIQVTNATELTNALATAQPGDVITMADGVYNAKSTVVTVGTQTTSAVFRITRSGTATQPITLQGSRNAIINGKPGGDGTGSDYGLHIFNSRYWNIRGIRVTNSSKGIILDGAHFITLDSVEVDTVGAEAVHFRSFSSDNSIRNSLIRDTGKKQIQYGEGVYIGSATSNWGTYTGGNPDASDRNQILNNTFTDFTAEALDIKEGSSNGIIRGNSFDGSKLSGQNSADSWVDVKGNNYTITDNIGINLHYAKPGGEDSLAGYQTHNLSAGWGNNNTFSNNHVNVQGGLTDDNQPTGAYGFWIDPKTSGNRVLCNNTVTNAQLGFANITCTN